MKFCVTSASGAPAKSGLYVVDLPDDFRKDSFSIHMNAYHNAIFNKKEPNMNTTIERLTTFNGWTIALEKVNRPDLDMKSTVLIAFNDSGETIRAKGCLLSAGGNAWMWHEEQLWTGPLALVKTERQEKSDVYLEKCYKLDAKYYQKIDALHEKLNEEKRELREEVYGK